MMKGGGEIEEEISTTYIKPRRGIVIIHEGMYFPKTRINITTKME
jgi:hypothetical protein